MAAFLKPYSVRVLQQTTGKTLNVSDLANDHWPSGAAPLKR